MRVSIELGYLHSKGTMFGINNLNRSQRPKNIIRDLHRKRAPAGLLCLAAEVHHMKIIKILMII